MPAKSWRSRMSMAPWSAAPASKPMISGRSRRPANKGAAQMPRRRWSGWLLAAEALTYGGNPDTAAAPMIVLLFVVHVLIAIALVGVVLLQKSEGGALGMGGGGMSGFMTGRSTANLLTRTTAILAALFFLTSIILVVLGNAGRTPRSMIDEAPPGPVVPLAPSPAAPQVPVAPATPALLAQPSAPLA